MTGPGYAPSFILNVTIQKLMRNLFLSTLAFVVLGICSMRVNAGTLAVSENMNSGISNADCIGTLSDGTILGFSRSRYNSMVR